MVPATYPTNANGSMIVFEVDGSSTVRWRDWIPVFDVTSGDALTYEDTGYIPVEVLADVTGLTAWVDYIPVDFVSESLPNVWRTNDLGYIPVVAEA